ncbi:TPA: hypothetical protein MIC00_26710 [Klebsiella pneumoniae]|nr:hypothetical protein [Klebsiella pneumoniae]
MWLMKTLLTSGCTNQRGAGQAGQAPVYRYLAHLFSEVFNRRRSRRAVSLTYRCYCQNGCSWINRCIRMRRVTLPAL